MLLWRISRLKIAVQPMRVAHFSSYLEALCMKFYISLLEDSKHLTTTDSTLIIENTIRHELVEEHTNAHKNIFFQCDAFDPT